MFNAPDLKPRALTQFVEWIKDASGKITGFVTVSRPLPEKEPVRICACGGWMLYDEFWHCWVCKECGNENYDEPSNR